MNFIKNSFNKLFGKQQEKPATKNEVEEAAEEPNQELVYLFKLTAQILFLSKQPMSDQMKLQLYAFYKQATEGNCNTPKPSLLEFVKKAKWDTWDKLKGMSKSSAMKNYVAASAKADKNLQQKLIAQLQGENYVEGEGEAEVKNQFDSFGLKMVEQKDFSNAYSHPYFKNIEKGEPLQAISHELLLQTNNSPKVYPLHFAIDKERVDLVSAFLPLLTVEEIQSMKDEDGTGILEYAELIENQEILTLIRVKLS